MIRNVIGELELDETLTSRDTINSKLRAVLDDATNKWGVKVNRVELQDITPPESVKKAMEQQMQAKDNRIIRPKQPTLCASSMFWTYSVSRYFQAYFMQPLF